jgi:hypothetical protein
MSSETLDNKKIIPDGYSGEEEDPGKVMSIILHLSVVLFPIVFFISQYFSLKSLYTTNYLWTVFLAFPFAWIAGDVITGIVHWLCDTYGTVNTPIFGQALIRHFRSHHTYPRDICVSPFAYTVGNVAIATLLTLPIPTYFAIINPNSVTWNLITFTYSIIALLTLMTNQFHKWAHLEVERVPNYIKFLQKNKIILDPIHHKVHHTKPYESYYCITHGLANPFLEKIHFFRNLEKILAIFGFNPAI